MTDGTSKAKKNKQDAGVLAGLPSTRPSRMSRRGRSGGPSVEATRAAASRAADTREATGSRASGKRTTAADKTRKPAPTAKAPAKAAAAKPKAATAKAKSAAPKKAAAPKRATAKAKPAGPKKAGATRLAPAPTNVAPISEAPKPARKPRAVRAATPALKEPTAQAEARREDVPVARPTQSGTELVTTVVQAAGELASIGVTIGGQILKRAASKLPRP